MRKAYIIVTVRRKRAEAKERLMRRNREFMAAFGVAVGMLAGCVVLGPAQQPNLIATDLPGTWVSGDGASITLTGGGFVTATKFDFSKVIPTRA